MKITIKDVAREAGVSVSTVSKVINDHSSISDATKEKVKKIITDLNYEPNIQARNFVLQQTHHLIFLTRFEHNMAFHNPHMFEIMSGVEKQISDNGYYLSFKSVETDYEALQFTKTVITQKRADGIIIHGSLATKELTQFLIQSSFPYIIIGKPTFITKATWIDTNNYLSGQLSGEHLLEKGYQKIAFVGGYRTDNIFKQRLYGFLQSMREAKLSVPEHFIKCGEPPTKDGGYRLAVELLSAPELPEVIICENNFVALGVLQAITEQGLRIPEDIDYLCFDAFPLAQTIEPKPIIIDADTFNLGFQAGSLLLQRIKNPALQMQTHSTMPYILEREIVD